MLTPNAKPACLCSDWLWVTSTERDASGNIKGALFPSQEHSGNAATLCHTLTMRICGLSRREEQTDTQNVSVWVPWRQTTWVPTPALPLTNYSHFGNVISQSVKGGDHYYMVVAVFRTVSGTTSAPDQRY